MKIELSEKGRTVEMNELKPNKKEKLKAIKKEWKNKYIDRITLACGDKKFATECYNAGEHDYEEDPVEMAESEMSYWDT